MHPSWAEIHPITQLSLYLSPHQPHKELMRCKEIHQALQSEGCVHVFHATSGARVKHPKMGMAASKVCMLKVFLLLLGPTGQKQ